MDEQKIENLEQIISLWTKNYLEGGTVNWSHILPYYHRDMFFKNSIKEVHGIEKFTNMTERRFMQRKFG